jgi:hypothetical protein
MGEKLLTYQAGRHARAGVLVGETVFDAALDQAVQLYGDLGATQQHHGLDHRVSAAPSRSGSHSSHSTLSRGGRRIRA